MPKPKRYTVSDGKLVLVLEVAEEGGYIVSSPFNPDVLTQAETIEEAFENARDLIALFREDRASMRGVKPPATAKSRTRFVSAMPKRHSAAAKSGPKSVKKSHTKQQPNPA